MKSYEKYFDKVIGYNSVKDELYHQLDIMSDPEKYRGLNTKLEKGIIIVGEPGMGKTLLANSFINAASEYGYRSFVVRKDKHDEEFLEYLNSVFKEANDSNKAVIVLDDLDKYKTSRDSEVFTIIQSLIDDSNENVMILATCNSIQDVYKSLLRFGRLGYRINLEIPNKEDTRLIIQYYLSGKKIADDVDVEEVRRYLDGHSVSTLESVISRAATYAGYENSDVIKTEHILRAFLRVLYKTSEEFTEDDEKTLKAIATHEASHTAAMEVLDPGSITLVSVKRHGNVNIKGITLYDRKEEYELEGAREMKQRVMLLLAGKVGTEIFLGDEDAGASGDLNRAYDLVRQYVINNSSLGYSNLYDIKEGDIIDQRLLNKQDVVIQSIISDLSIKVRKILIANREFVEKLIDELVDKKTINYKDISRIRSTCNIAMPNLL